MPASSGRNEPCHCGSGRKYKKCHWTADQAREPVRHATWRSRFTEIHDEGVSRRVSEVERLFAKRGIRRADPKQAKSLDALFQESCRQRWISLRAARADLEEASQMLAEADSSRFRKSYREGLKERRTALEGPLSLLHEAGEAGVAHLASWLMEDSWASVLAVEGLVLMPSGPLRDRALAEAIFVESDWLNDTVARHAKDSPYPEWWPAFETVARAASADGLPLQGVFWVTLFEERGDGPAAMRPTTDLGPAMRLLYDLGHFPALAEGVERWLDPMMDGEPGVRAFVDDPGVQAALRHIEEKEGAGLDLRPARELSV